MSLFRHTIRKFSSGGAPTTSTSAETTSDAAGMKRLYKSIASVSTRLSTMSPFARRAIIGYLVGGAVTTSVLTYQDGKEALDRHRQRANIDNRLEWGVVKDACRARIWKRTWEGVTWPFEITSSVMPSVVLSLNPKR